MEFDTENLSEEELRKRALESLINEDPAASIKPIDTAQLPEITPESEFEALKGLSAEGSIVPQTIDEYGNKVDINPLESAAKGAGDIATMGWGPELSATVGALAPTDTDKGYTERWSNIRNQLKKESEKAKMANPDWYTGGQVFGGVATGAALPFATGSIPAAAGSLAAYGAIQGAGEAGEGNRLEGAYEGAKSMVTAPVELAKATGQKLRAGEMGEAAGTSALMALSILPFAIKGKPVNEFVLKRAKTELDSLTQSVKESINTGDFKQAQTIIDKIRNDSKVNTEAWQTYQKQKFSANDTPLMKELSDSQFAVASLAGEQDGAANALERMLKLEKKQELSSKLEKTRQTVDTMRQMREDQLNPRSEFEIARAKKIKDWLASPESDSPPIQVKDKSGQVHEVNPLEKKSEVYTDEQFDKDFAQANEIKDYFEANPAQLMKIYQKQGLTPPPAALELANRKVVPPNVFEAKLNALKSLKNQPRVTMGPDWEIFKKSDAEPKTDLEKAAKTTGLMTVAETPRAVLGKEPLKLGESTANEYLQAVESASEKRPLIKEMTTKYTPEEIKDFKKYLSPDEKSGFMLKPDGEITALFSSEKGRGEALVQEAIKQGGTKLDAFDGYLPKLYEKYGFKEYKREPNWTQGQPDVVYMAMPEKHPELFKKGK